MAWKHNSKRIFLFDLVKMPIYGKRSVAMIADRKDKKNLIVQIKHALLAGLLFSIVVTSAWFFFEGVGTRMLAFVILSTSVIILILKLLFDIVMDRIKCSTKLADGLFIGFAVLAFAATTISALGTALLFIPNADKKAYQSLLDTQQAEALAIETEHGTFTGWFVHHMEGNAPLVLYFGGNGENASARVKWLTDPQKENVYSIFAGCNFAYVDYPGYGTSDGTTSEKSLKQYGLVVYDTLIAREDVSNIIVMGYSLGTGVANYVASQRQPAGMILMAPYANGYDLYNNYLNIFHGPLKTLVLFPMRAEKFAEKVNIKPLILASRSDEIVPYESAAALFQAYKKGCNFVTIDDIGHGEFWGNNEVLSEIRKYLQTLI